MVRTLISGAVVVTGDADGAVIPQGDVLLEDEKIAWVGSGYDGDYDHRVSAHGQLLMPGLINAHTHSSMTLFRSLSDDQDLMVFLERVWPREIRATPDEAYAGSLLAGIEMLKSGITTYVDMYFFEDMLAQAALDTGIRAVITPGILAVPAWEPMLGNWEQRTANVLAFSGEWEGRAGRIHTGLGPHAPYTLPLQALREIAAEARRHDLLVHIHLLETQGERDEFLQRDVGGVIEALEQIDFFDGKVLAAHSVWLDDNDIEIYRRHGVGVAHCPQSNAKLGSGIAPIDAMLAAGVQVGLGTDGAATNNNLNLWEEMTMACLLAKVGAHDPKPVTVLQALAMATRMGARAIHRPDLGAIASGMKADLVLLRLDDAAMVPIFEPRTYLSHLVYSAGRELVDSVWVHGTEVVKRGEVLMVDEEEARRAAQRAAIQLARRAEA